MINDKGPDALSLGYSEAPEGSPLRSERLTILFRSLSLEVVNIFNEVKKEVEISLFRQISSSMCKYAFDNAFIMEALLKSVPKHLRQAREYLGS